MIRINNLQELLAEQKRTEALIADQKAELTEHFQALTLKMEPFLRLLPIINLFKKGAATTPNKSALKMGASVVVDLLMGQKLLSKANWLARLVIPSLLRVISSSLIDKTAKGKFPREQNGTPHRVT